jgi:glycosyltransferase involved in cell wall biosynthesis
MRILFITPYPPSYYRVRSYSFLKQLSQRHDVTIAALCRTEREVADALALRHQGYEMVMVREPQWRAWLRCCWALVRQDSLHTALARSARFTDVLNAICESRQFDVVHVEHLRGMVAADSTVCAYPLVWDAVDCISLLYQHTAISGPNLPWRLIASREYRRIQRHELNLLRSVQQVVVTSERDRQALLALTCWTSETLLEGERCTYPSISVLPNGVDVPSLDYLPQERRRYNLVFSGKMNYHPNLVAALYLYEHIMPLIWERQPLATLTLAGGDPPSAIKRLAQDPRIEVTGFVADLRPYISRAEVMLCPMLYGTGIQNKVLEAMALGTPIVASPLAVAALNIRAGHHVLVASSPCEFAEAVERLFGDEPLRAALAQHAREYIQRNHNWQSVTDQLVGIYQQAIAVHRRGIEQRSQTFQLVPITEP